MYRALKFVAGSCIAGLALLFLLADGSIISAWRSEHTFGLLRDLGGLLGGLAALGAGWFVLEAVARERSWRNHDVNEERIKTVQITAHYLEVALYVAAETKTPLQDVVRGDWVDDVVTDAILTLRPLLRSPAVKASHVDVEANIHRLPADAVIGVRLSIDAFRDLQVMLAAVAGKITTAAQLTLRDARDVHDLAVMVEVQATHALERLPSVNLSDHSPSPG